MPSSRALQKPSSLTPSTPSSPRSWQPCANAGPADPREAPLSAGPVGVLRGRDRLTVGGGSGKRPEAAAAGVTPPSRATSGAHTHHQPHQAAPSGRRGRAGGGPPLAGRFARQNEGTIRTANGQSRLVAGKGFEPLTCGL